MSNKRFIISGGGTGGHVFPAIAIADALRQQDAACDILFVGAEGRMEMERVPAAGYKIIGLPIAGLHRRRIYRNFKVLWRLWKSLRQARRIIKQFAPDAVIGVGGFASAPIVWQAQRRGIFTLIQEQNSYAGLTNRLLGRGADAVCVACEGMERYFKADKILLTGNPVRKDILQLEGKRAEALSFFGLDAKRPVLLVMSGSLGARCMNEAVMQGLGVLQGEGVQVLWATGTRYYEGVKMEVEALPYVRAYPFIKEMSLAYAVADVIVSRAGAMAISELAVIGKPVILVPSPNVAEDHQTKNAMYVVEQGGGVMIRDEDLHGLLVSTVLDVMNDDEKKHLFSQAIRQLAFVNAAEKIVSELLKE